MVISITHISFEPHASSGTVDPAEWIVINLTEIYTAHKTQASEVYMKRTVIAVVNSGET